MSDLTIAVSACLLGTPCRYNGTAKPCAVVQRLRELPGITVVPICPEVSGGLSIPHPPSEITQGAPRWHVINAEGTDVTEAFVHGAQKTLERVRNTGCNLAVLKAKSPSCGHGLVYDGSFTDTLVPGDGVAARMLLDADVKVIDEAQLEELWDAHGSEGIVGALKAMATQKGTGACGPLAVKAHCSG